MELLQVVWSVYKMAYIAVVSATSTKSDVVMTLFMSPRHLLNVI